MNEKQLEALAAEVELLDASVTLDALYNLKADIWHERVQAEKQCIQATTIANRLREIAHRLEERHKQIITDTANGRAQERNKVP